MKGLEQLQKRRKPVLVKMAQGLDIKVSRYWNKPTLAKKILEKQKLNELEEPEPKSEPEPVESKRKPDFDILAPEATDVAPEAPQLDEQGPDVYRDRGGRTPGLTDEKARVQRILKNQVPDPVIKFAFECLFEGWESVVKVKGIALSKDETNTIAVTTTNLKEYYFPGLDISPVLEMWIGLAIGVKAVVQSRIVLIRESRKLEPVEEPTESGDNAK